MDILAPCNWNSQDDPNGFHIGNGTKSVQIVNHYLLRISSGDQAGLVPFYYAIWLVLDLKHPFAAYSMPMGK